MFAEKGKKGEIHKDKVDKIIEALKSVSGNAVQHTRRESRGGDMYEYSGLQGMEKGVYGFTKNGSTAPGRVYSQEEVDNLIALLATQIANNGKEVQKPKQERKWIKGLSSALLGLLVALLIIAGVKGCENRQQHENLSDDNAIEQVDESNYKDRLIRHLDSIETYYYSLLSNYAGLQGSEDLKEVDKVVREETKGEFKTLESYLEHVKELYQKYKELCNKHSNKNLENNEMFKEAYDELYGEYTLSVIGDIKESGFNAITTPSGRALEDLKQKYGFELDEGMGQ